jgi:7-carboxy-7-deazaguanine synthase
LVEVTGGDPLAQKNVFPFITQLLDDGYEVLIETGGFFSTENVDAAREDYFGRKMSGVGRSGKKSLGESRKIKPEKDEVKFVIADLNDWEFAREIIEKYDLETRAKEILISPIFGIENLQEIAETVAQKRFESSPESCSCTNIFGARTFTAFN